MEEVGERRGEGDRKKLRCVIYMYQFFKMNVIVHCKYILIKNKLAKLFLTFSRATLDLHKYNHANGQEPLGFSS